MRKRRRRSDEGERKGNMGKEEQWRKKNKKERLERKQKRKCDIAATFD